MTEAFTLLKSTEGRTVASLDRREMLKRAMIGGMSLSLAARTCEALAQRETEKEKITPTYMPPELVRDGIPLSMGGRATVEDCPVWDAEQRLIIMRHIHPVDDMTKRNQYLVDRASVENGEAMEVLVDRWGINSWSAEGFTDNRYRTLKNILVKKHRNETLTHAEQQQMNKILGGIKYLLPKCYELFANGKIVMIPGESEEAHKAAIEYGTKHPDERTPYGICERDREDACLEIAYKSRVKVIATIWGSAHWQKLSNGRRGDLPSRILNRNLRDFGTFSAAFITPPIVIDEFKEYKKRGELDPSHEYLLEGL